MVTGLLLHVQANMGFKPPLHQTTWLAIRVNRWVHALPPIRTVLELRNTQATVSFDDLDGLQVKYA